MIDKRRKFTTASIALLFAACLTIAVYILLVVASFFVVMPSATQSLALVGSLMFMIFAVAFVVTFRRLLNKSSS